MRADSREALLEVFDAEAVGRAFYAAYVKIFQESVVSGIYGESSRQTYQDFFLAFTVRVLFLSFVAKKGWLGDQGARFLPWLLERYQTVAQQEEATGFYNRWLRPLFFEAFRAAPSAKTARFRTLPEDIAIIYRDAPFLNGELFRRQPFDARLALTDEVIARFFTFLYGHNFILEESTHDDVDLELARQQLRELITRDKNRAAVILWSVANETPRGEARLRFLRTLIDEARRLDPTRLVTAALEHRYVNDTTIVIDDELGRYLDVLGNNEYIGWYDGPPEKARRVVWQNAYDKPLIMSEWGGGAKAGFHGPAEQIWTEEYQARLYREQIAMLRRIPFLVGMSPWILKDFRSPRRPLARIQDYWNRKGVISDRGQRKQAFYVLQAFYRELAQSAIND